MYPLEKSIIQHEFHELKKLAPKDLAKPTSEMLEKDLDQATQWVRYGGIVGNAPRRIESLLKRIHEARVEPLPDAATWYAAQNLATALMMKSEMVFAKVNIARLTPLMNNFDSLLSNWDKDKLLPVYYLDRTYLATPRYEGLSIPEINQEIVAGWMFDLRSDLIFAVTELEDLEEYKREARRYHLLMDNGGSGAIERTEDGSNGRHTSLVPGNRIGVVRELLTSLESLVDNYQDTDDSLGKMYSIYDMVSDVNRKLTFAINALSK
jgi:hypothetical protein